MQIVLRNRGYIYWRKKNRRGYTLLDSNEYTPLAVNWLWGLIDDAQLIKLHSAYTPRKARVAQWAKTEHGFRSHGVSELE